ncbi:NAD(P)/FAD-dependent oxidoreductase [Bacteroidota bacterium]
MKKEKTALIIGAGPAGLTAAFELLKQTDIKPIIFESTSDFGGISKTVNYKGNYIDIGGHRFFSKSERIMDWWKAILPVEEENKSISYDEKNNNASVPKTNDLVMLVRSRLSRIYFLRKFFLYPISLNLDTIKKLGLKRLFKIGYTYLIARIFPVKNEKSLEDFFINRFGKELYNIFFKDYTEKVWGVPCSKIEAEWGAQRIKGLSVQKAIGHALKSIIKKEKSIKQEKTETSLIEKFLYPKFGPGQMWNEVANIVKDKGGEIYLEHQVTGFEVEDSKLVRVIVKNISEGTEFNLSPNYVFSSMPVKDLINSFISPLPAKVTEVANGLVYRDFITIGLLLNKLLIKNETGIKTKNNIVPDNWIYIQEPDVKVGRLQIFNNWSPYMVKDPSKVWLGLEYFCDEGDELWSLTDEKIKELAIQELADIDIIDKDDVIDSVLIRMQKTYPAYFGTYSDFSIIRNYTDNIENLFLIGRNGMHKYNNQDHSMLTAMTAVENIVNGINTKDNIWSVNTEEEYHEKK